MTPNPGRYWRESVELQPRWNYDLDKPAHVALITLALVVVARRDWLTASLIAAVLYFGIGKLLVSMELIPHGGHKTLLHEAVQWAAEITAIAIVPALAWAAAGHGLPNARILAPIGALAAYVVAASGLSMFPDS